ncbi:MAG: ATP-binding protein, partial [candidate division FCPU426 bacterium]
DKDFALRAWGPWSVMALGMLFTALMGSFLLAATGRSVVIQRMAVERARDMADANEALRKEVIERKNAEVTLRKRDAELLQAQKMEVVGRLSGGVAHDFNNMLTVILGSAKLAQQESGLPPVLGAYLSDIESAGEKAADLTQRLLAMSRKQVLAPRILDLNQLVQESEALIRRVVSEEVELKVVLAKQDNLVHADWAQLQQAVINLAINARDAMPKGGRIEMGVHRLEIVEPDPLAFPGMKPGIWEEFYVKDSGSGIDPEILPHIFEPFFTTKDKGKGTGLGLAMVYGIVTQSGGVLDVKTTLGQGSTFSIRLPHAEDAPLGVSSGPHPGPFAPAESGSRSGTLLLVEDDEQVRKLLTEVLTRRGYKVLQAGGGGEALEILKHRKSELSLMISDMMMPGLGGRDLAREATVLAPGMPILLVSGYTEPMDFAQEFGPGAHFMPKPLAPDALLAKVAEILGPKA